MMQELGVSLQEGAMAKRAVVVIECRNKEHAEAVLERVAKRYQAYITEKSTFLIDLFMGSVILFMCTVMALPFITLLLVLIKFAMHIIRGN